MPPLEEIKNGKDILQIELINKGQKWCGSLSYLYRWKIKCRSKVKCQYLYIIWPSVALIVIVVSVECVYDIINNNNEALNTCVV